MKTKLLQLAMLAAMLCAGARAAEPPVTVTIEPQEGLDLIYAPVGALSAGVAPTGRLWFSLKIQNNEAPMLTLRSIRVTLTGVDVSIPRNLRCPGNETTSDALIDDRWGGAGTTNEIITIPHPAAAVVTIRLYFAGNLTPKTLLANLAPYVPATPNGQYLYPADEGDIGPNEYFSAGIAHGPGGQPDGQFWGADWNLSRIISQGSTTAIRAGGVNSVNEDYLGWGVPIRAIADGVVLQTSLGFQNNPAPGRRAIQQMSEYVGEAIHDVKVTRLSATRAASLARVDSGNFELTIWNIADIGRQLTRLGSSPIDPAERVTAIAVDELKSDRVVTAVRLNNGTLRLIVWRIPEDGQILERPWQVDDVAVSEVSLMRMSGSRFATAVRTAGGNLRVAVYKFADNEVTLLAEDTAGAATSVNITALSPTRLAASWRNNAGNLQVGVWDFENDNTLVPRGVETAESATKVVAAIAPPLSDTSNTAWVTAFCASGTGKLTLIRWTASADGQTLTPDGQTTGAAIDDQALAASMATGGNVVTASVAGNSFKLDGWKDPEANLGPYTVYGAAEAVSPVNRLSIDEAGVWQFFVGSRTSDGRLKIMTWYMATGGGNSVVMLHGDCRVLYAHFQEGSVDTGILYPGATVRAGQMLGRMGNSGSSGGPHTHIHSERIFPLTSIPDMIAREALDTLPLIGGRPMPFTGARAMRFSEISPGGEGNAANSFATMNGHGMYDVALGIRPRLLTRYVDHSADFALSRDGHKELLPGTRSDTGGPTLTVGSVFPFCLSGTRLYIRGGSYDEATTFNTPMTVRRYDFYDREPNGPSGPVLIGK